MVPVNGALAQARAGKVLVFKAFGFTCGLISHQEDFAEAFSDGYHFELEAGATRIKRFQK
jgi:hypothetical protein